MALARRFVAVHLPTTARMYQSALSLPPFRLSGTINSSSPVRFFSGKKNSKKASDDDPNTQHEEWVKFQQAISVDGFDTGQITSVSTVKKTRGGKLARKKKERELALKEQSTELADIGGGQYPALRYSEEETQRLLAEAYANLPKRTGKRGTRNKRRQRLRWHRVRKIHKKQKRWRIAAHFRRMDKRSSNKKAVMEIKSTSANTRQKDREYQDAVVKRWAEMFVSDYEGNREIAEQPGS